MKLLTKGVLASLPPLYTNDGKSPKDIKVPLKLFNPCGSESWFFTEYDPETKIGYGYVTGTPEEEMGYTSIEELESLRLPYGLGIERDLHWNPKNTLQEVMDKTVS